MKKLYIVSCSVYVYGVHRTKENAIKTKQMAVADGATNVVIKYRKPQHQYITTRNTTMNKLYEMTHCSNPASVGIQYVGVIATLTIKDRFYFSNLFSSTIQDVDTDGGTTIIKTRNTEYPFKEIEDEDDYTKQH